MGAGRLWSQPANAANTSTGKAAFDRQDRLRILISHRIEQFENVLLTLRVRIRHAERDEYIEGFQPLASPLFLRRLQHGGGFFQCCFAFGFAAHHTGEFFEALFLR